MLVGWLVVGWFVFPLYTFLVFLSFFSLLLLPKCSSDLLQHWSCPTASDWGSRVSGLVRELKVAVSFRQKVRKFLTLFPRRDRSCGGRFFCWSFVDTWLPDLERPWRAMAEKMWENIYARFGEKKVKLIDPGRVDDQRESERSWEGQTWTILPAHVKGEKKKLETCLAFSTKKRLKQEKRRE